MAERSETRAIVTSTAPPKTVDRAGVDARALEVGWGAREAGYELDAGQSTEKAPLRTEFVRVCFYNQATARTDRLVGVLDKALTEIEPPLRSLADRSPSATVSVKSSETLTIS
ncbi:hypothetical protein R3Q06_35765 [Rhodococcus erythropolis]|uniref:hypothetical protein n=1 Tax=Rhodococcus erythropolis TaxID=1833 RepID=UPI00294A5E57|nr:hypothetical protein [Rhodococcus erythropolis]MDV6278729.1 hypothetical protein [Rhodococcus erythropolis]